MAFGSIVAVLAVSGNLTMLALTVLGFVSFGLVFMGMMCVLPSTVTHPGTPTTPAMPAAAKRAVLRIGELWPPATRDLGVPGTGQKSA